MAAAPATVKILYNDCYGDFRFSQAFIAEYKVRTGQELNTRDIYRIGSESIRRDPVAITLVEEHGSEWASGPTSCITVREIPAVFAHYWEINEYDGNETVRVMFAEALADLLETYMETKDHAALERGYAAIQEGRAIMLYEKDAVSEESQSIREEIKAEVLADS